MKESNITAPGTVARGEGEMFVEEQANQAIFPASLQVAFRSGLEELQSSLLVSLTGYEFFVHASTDGGNPHRGPFSSEEQP
jgi:hypothetical protein